MGANGLAQYVKGGASNVMRILTIDRERGKKEQKNKKQNKTKITVSVLHPTCNGHDEPSCLMLEAWGGEREVGVNDGGAWFS